MRKNVEGYEGMYQVDELGNVYSIRYKKEKKLTPYNCDGYLKVCLCGKQLFLHRVVAKAFVENPLNKPEVNHENGIKKDCRASNLTWVTHAENMQHAIRTRLVKREKGYNCKKPVTCLDLETKEVIKEFDSISEAVDWCGLKVNHISQVCKGLKKSSGGYSWKFTNNGVH